MAEVLRYFLKQKAMAFLKENTHTCALFSYSSDATSLLCQSVAGAKLEGEHVTRRGRVLHEFLMQRGYLKVKGSCGKEAIVILI